MNETQALKIPPRLGANLIGPCSHAAIMHTIRKALPAVASA
jgi:hypothetical protein